MTASADLLTISALPSRGDPLVVAPGARLGVLGIEPHTRRRNRMNGVVESVDASGFSIHVQQSFGNCPKYIVPRKVEVLPEARGDVVRYARLDGAAVRMLRAADTFFIATAYPGGEGDARSHGVDVSHRGGEPGFIQVEDGVLRIPDYVGNYYFNTLGNLALNPKAGLLVVDWVSGARLWLAVTVEIVWEGKEVEAISGARRVLKMSVASSRRLL